MRGFVFTMVKHLLKSRFLYEKTSLPTRINYIATRIGYSASCKWPFCAGNVPAILYVMMEVVCVSKKVAEGGKKCQNLTCGQKNSLVNQLFTRLFSAQEWIRTITSLRTLRPEHSASTNFATWATAAKRLQVPAGQYPGGLQI